MAPPTPIPQLQNKKESTRLVQGFPLNGVSKAAAVESPSAQQLQRELNNSMSHLSVKEPSSTSGLVHDHQKISNSRGGIRLEEDQTQVSSSSTKPASPDGKSTTSGTTFALDEKESLRPDDSASVKAAEEDEFGSGPASGAQNSRVGSEAGSRAFRDQFHEIRENLGSNTGRMHVQSRRTIAGIEEEEPQMAHLPHASTPSGPINVPPTLPPPIGTTNGPSYDHKYQEPDEKLLEALESPKDRLFLLKLEQEVIAFIQDRSRAPLSAMAPTPTNIDSTMSSQPTMKIMRRTGLCRDGQNDSGANTTDGSMAPSKAGSEVGNDSQQGTGVVSPNESTVAKDKPAMTREEREAIYKETRERIFGPETENAESTDVNNQVSRTSSRNEKKKRKHKTNDDGFTARSQYNVFYSTMPYPTGNYEQNGDAPVYYGSYASQAQSAVPQNGTMATTMFQQGFQQGYQSMINVPPFHNGVPGNSIGVYDMQGSPGYSQPMPQHYYSQMPQAMGMGIGQQSSATSPPTMNNNGQCPPQQPQLQFPDPQWTPENYSYHYPQPRDQQQYFSPQMQSQNISPASNTVPYQYGQLPAQPGLNGAKAQHPLPGSYKSQSLNPQIRAFIPNGGTNPSQFMHHEQSPSHPMNRSPAMSFQNGNPYPTHSQQMSPYTQGPPMQTPSLHSFNHEPKNHGTRKSSSQSTTTQSPVQSSLSKWGTPSHLPPKPPPPETPIVPEGQHSLPLNNQFNASVQPLHGGQPMPSYQNGVYSMPNANPQPQPT
ncbi:hypothetical protein ACLMJK_007282 [Lecanora helva]